MGGEREGMFGVTKPETEALISVMLLPRKIYTLTELTTSALL